MASTKPATVAIAEREGGQWLPFPHRTVQRVHAIRFSDGSVWDAINGWRQPAFDDRAHTSEMDDAAELERLIADG